MNPIRTEDELSFWTKLLVESGTREEAQGNLTKKQVDYLLIECPTVEHRQARFSNIVRFKVDNEKQATQLKVLKLLKDNYLGEEKENHPDLDSIRKCATTVRDLGVQAPTAKPGPPKTADKVAEKTQKPEDYRALMERAVGGETDPLEGTDETTVH